METWWLECHILYTNIVKYTSFISKTRIGCEEKTDAPTQPKRKQNYTSDYDINSVLGIDCKIRRFVWHYFQQLSKRKALFTMKYRKLYNI